MCFYYVGGREWVCPRYYVTEVHTVSEDFDDDVVKHKVSVPRSLDHNETSKTSTSSGAFTG